MKPVSENVLREFEELAMESAKQIRQFFKYEGDNPRYYQRAKVGVTQLAQYVNLRATEGAREALQFQIERASDRLPPAAAPKQIGPATKK